MADSAAIARGVLGSLAFSFHAMAATASEPFEPLPFAVPADAAKVVLGDRLFHDPRLSHHRQRSCATCHPLDRGGMDGQARGAGADGTELRNTPTVFNVGFSFFFNWDGSTTTLQAHAEKVLSNPRVMNSRWPELLPALQADAGYVRGFTAAYPDGVTPTNVLDALATFERSLVTPNSRFDRYLRGDDSALDRAEQRGYQLFKSLGCVACHQGLNIGGNLFQKFGIFETPMATQRRTHPRRDATTMNDADRDIYRVPSLRNVAVTAPYFHDGRARTLEEAVDVMAERQLGRRLSRGERDLIVRFLHSLTGEFRGRPVTREMP